MEPELIPLEDSLQSLPREDAHDLNSSTVSQDQPNSLFRQLGGGDLGDEEEKAIAFLGAVNDDNFDRTIPSSVPSGISPGAHIE